MKMLFQFNPRRPARWFMLLMGSCIALSPLVMLPTAIAQPSTQMQVVPPVRSNVLERGTWQLVEWQSNNQPIPLIPANPITIQFAGNRLSGSTGCNSYGSQYQIQNSRLQLVGALAMTRRACQPPIAQRERNFLAALKSVTQLTLDRQNRLVMQYAAPTNRGTLIFANSTMTPISQLRATPWQLTTIITNTNSVPVTLQPPITVQFTEDSVRGFAGCNQYNGPYQHRHTQLRIGAIASTKKACPPPQMQLEQEFLSALSNVQRFEINSAGELRLFVPDQTKTLVLTPRSR